MNGSLLVLRGSWEKDVVSPEAMKDKAMEADRLFRRGCLQYLDDLGL